MKRLFLIIGVLWLVIIVGFIGIKEYTLQTGWEVRLKTVPVDPRDLFRGDYVILSYAISSIDLSQASVAEAEYTKGKTIYVLIGTENDYGEVRGFQASPPEQNKLFLKGRILSVRGKRANVEYGIESYFVPEGEGKRLERVRGDALDVVIAVDKQGNAVIKRLMLDGRPIQLS